jgi:tRNA dimethylallyltransferase
MAEQNIIRIGGPTASGKSALAMQLARERRGTIINADAMQIYAGLPLLTAQPEAADKAEIPHLLYEVMDAAEASSAGKWLGLARASIAQVLAEGRTPIVVGGTGFYFATLQGGLAEIPAIPESVRAEVSALYDKIGEVEFRAGLEVHDADSATRIKPNDRQRLIRAYEVVMHTGKSLSEWQKADKAESSEEYEMHLLMPPREELYAACNARFVKMIERGALEEVRALMARDLSPDLPAMKILGVRELAAYLRREISLDAAVEKAQQMTRNYAKRQVTWFRNQWG